MESLSNLASISNFAQELAVSAASFTHLGITIVDENLVRIAGTGEYFSCLGDVLTPHTISYQVLRTGKTFVLDKPRLDPLCRNCELKKKCLDRAVINHPIIIEGNTIGNMALIAFNNLQRKQLLENVNTYTDFLDKMALLLAIRLESLGKDREVSILSHQVQSLMSIIGHGVLWVDSEGRILLFNEKAKQLLGGDLHSGLPIPKLIPGVKWPTAKLEDNIISRENEVFCININAPDSCCTLVEVKPVSFINEREQESRKQERAKDPVAVATFDDLIGQHPNFVASINMARKYSEVDATVLIIAETGTGKDLFAQSIHNLSSRRNGPFLNVNCAAVPHSLLESELFGYSEGSFTGAKRSGKKGLFEVADHGTVFLDEISEMPPRLQSSLLRVLQSKEVRRIGDDKIIPVDVRIIAASNKNISKMVEKGRFRADLFYRLNMLKLEIPPLRERIEDIPLLVQYFAIQTCRTYKKPPVSFTRRCIGRLQEHSWPGNIRELFNVIQRLVLTCNPPVIDEKPLDQILEDNPDAGKSLINSDRIELEFDGSYKNLMKQIIEKLMSRYGEKKKVARILGISKTTLWRRLNSQ
jgi:transcriptional regulator with PAS, ATPase and Fis domain